MVSVHQPDRSWCQDHPNSEDVDDDLPPERIRKLLGIRMHGRISRVHLGRTGYYGPLVESWKGKIGDISWENLVMIGIWEMILGRI